METESHLEKIPPSEDIKGAFLNLVYAIADIPVVGYALGAIIMAKEEMQIAYKPQ